MAQEEESESITTINNSFQLNADISDLYLNKKFSDLTFLIEDEKLFAHKVILAARSGYFERLLYGDLKQVSKNEITIKGASVHSFKIFLEYIYTGNMALEQAKISLYLEVLDLAHQYSVEGLEISLSHKLGDFLDFKNIYKALNMANLYDLSELKGRCYKFLEVNSEQILADDTFSSLNQTSLIALLERDTFYLPELEIFKIVSKWRECNEDVDDLVLNCVRLSQLSVDEIVSQIRPSKLFESEKLFEAITESIGDSSGASKYRGQLVMDVNLATLGNKSNVIISGRNTSLLLTESRHTNTSTSNIIGKINSFTVDLGKPYFINHFFMRLWEYNDEDVDYESYMYYVEVSCNQQKWKKVVDYSNYPCRSFQNLYFEPEIARYVRVVGTHHANHYNFNLIFFEAYYKSTFPKIVNNIICPTKNVAHVDENAVGVEGTNPNCLINGDFKNYTPSDGYSSHWIGSEAIIVQLAQPYLVSTMKLLLWDGDDRIYKYYIETSVNKTDWDMAVDRRNEECQSWQNVTFTERVAVFIKITGTYNSVNNTFHCVHFECPANLAPIK